MKTSRNFARHPFGLIMMLLSLMIVAMSVLETAALVQASGDWIPTGSLNTPRVGHTATLLPDGKVLVVAGYSGTDFLSSAELYDPATETWNTTGSLNTPRYYPTATLLANGKVLVVGGDNSGGSAELYDPATGTWSVTGSLLVARSDHVATLLPNGKVLIAGGVTDYTDFDLPITVNSAELYDPVTGTWSIAANLNTSRGYHTVTLLQNGKVLVAGGWDGPSYGPLGSAELYDPVAGIWSYTGNLNILHYGHSATLLANGQVLVAGGASTNFAELYDPATATWRFTGAPNSGGPVILLPNGKVLLVAESGAKLYDPATGAWSATANPNPPHIVGTATLLPSGKVLVAGGLSRNTTCCIVFNVLNSAELYDPTAEGTLPLMISAPVLPDAEVGVAYSAPLVSGGHPPYTVNNVKGVFPQGLRDTLVSGALSGTPASSRSKSFTIQITDDLGSSVTGTFTVKSFPALENTTRALKTGINGRPYKTTLKAAGGKKPYNWSLVSGSLPLGLTLDNLTGAITGIPRQTGAFNLVFQASDPLGGIAATALTLTIK